MGVLGMVDWFKREVGVWPAGMPAQVMVCQHNPWSGYDWPDALNKVNEMDPMQPYYLRLIYDGDSSTGSTPRVQQEVDDHRQWIAFLLGGSFPQFNRAAGILIANEPNLEGGGLNAGWVAECANQLKDEVHAHGLRCGTPPIAPFHALDAQADYDPSNEHPTRTVAFPAEKYLWRLLTDLDADFNFLALHVYGTAQAGVGAEEPFRGIREGGEGRWYPWGTNCMRAQIAVAHSAYPVPVPVVVDEYNTGAHEESPSENYAAGWMHNAVRSAFQECDKTRGDPLEAFLWFTGDGARSWGDRSLKDRIGKMAHCRIDYDYLVDAGL